MNQRPMSGPDGFVRASVPRGTVTHIFVDNRSLCGIQVRDDEMLERHGDLCKTCAREYRRINP